MYVNQLNLANLFSLGVHVRAGDSNMKAGRGRESNIQDLVKRLHVCVSNVSKRMGNVSLIVVSDRQHVKSIMSNWKWLNVYISPTTAFHIDRLKILAF